MKQHNKKSGFTVIEAVITTLAIVIIAAGVVTMASTWPAAEINLDVVSHQIMNDVRFVQSLAMSANTHCRISFASTDYTIQCYNYDASAWITAQHPATPTSPIQLAGNVSFVTPTPACLAFNGAGTPYSCTIPGSALSSNTTIRLQSGTAIKNIGITTETGYAYLY